MRVFLDANILFSAAKSDGSIRDLLTSLRDAGHELVADAYVAEEAKRNLAAKYPAAEATLAEILGQEVTLSGFCPLPLSLEVELAEKDRPVLASAIALRCDTLVTGDSTHFGALFGEAVGGTRILSPRMLAELLFPSESG